MSNGGRRTTENDLVDGVKILSGRIYEFGERTITRPSKKLQQMFLAPTMLTAVFSQAAEPATHVETSRNSGNNQT